MEITYKDLATLVFCNDSTVHLYNSLTYARVMHSIIVARMVSTMTGICAGSQGIKGREDSTTHIAQLFPLLPSSPCSLVQLHTITMLFNVNVAAVVALAFAMSAYAAPIEDRQFPTPQLPL